MKRNLSDYIIALGVIACSAILLIALTRALGGSHGVGGARTVDVDFTDVTGVRLHSEVRYAGAPAGTVSRIRLLKNEERSEGSAQKFNAVRVTLDLFDGVPEIPSDVRASISSDTLLSEKFIALSAGSPGVPKLASGALLQGRSSASIDDLLGTVQPMLASIGDVLNSLDPIVKKTTDTLDTLRDGLKDALPKISKVADNAQSATASADVLVKRADKLIAEVDGPVKDDLAELKGALAKLQVVLKSTDGFVGNTDKQLAARMKELSVVLQNLKVASTYAKALTQALGEKPNRLIFSGKNPPLTPEAEILRSEKPVPATRP
jgi:ABC-type transporter Mla subunit MlaD